MNYHPGSPSPAALAIDPGLTIDDLEFLEVFNGGTNSIDLSDWRVRGEVDYEFEQSTVLASADTLVIISFDPEDPANSDRLAAWRTNYGADGNVEVVGGFSGNFDDGEGRVRLERPDDPPLEEPTYTPHVVEDELIYDNQFPWPSSAAGQGDSLRRLNSCWFGGARHSWEGDSPSPGIVLFDPPSEIIVSVERGDDEGFMKLTWNTWTGEVYSIHHSSNLLNWERIESATGIDASVSVEVPTEGPVGFFEIIQHP